MNGIHPASGFLRAVAALVGKLLDYHNVFVKCPHVFSRCEAVLREDERIIGGGVDGDEFR